MPSKSKVRDEVIVQESVAQRLQGLQCVPQASGSGLTIRCWRFQRQDVLERLSLSRTPVIQGIADSEANSGDSASNYLPILTGIPTNDVVSRNSSTGTEVLSADKGMLVDSSWVSSVELVKPDQLRIQLSKKGNEEFRKFTTEQTAALRVGLVVDGWIEGLTLEPVRDRRITFRMSDNSKRTLKSIQAAIRGPALPFELELLD